MLICPAASVSPFPHAQLFVEEINGEKMPTYMRWLAITYAPTMALACAAALPCGVDHLGMPFGIQVIGPNGSDARVLEVAHALEQVLARNKETARPVPTLPVPTGRGPGSKNKPRGCRADPLPTEVRGEGIESALEPDRMMANAARKQTNHDLLHELWEYVQEGMDLHLFCRAGPRGDGQHQRRNRRMHVRLQGSAGERTQGQIVWNECLPDIVLDGSIAAYHQSRPR